MTFSGEREPIRRTTPRFRDQEPRKVRTVRTTEGAARRIERARADLTRERTER